MAISTMQPLHFQQYLRAGHPSVTEEQLTNLASHESQYIRLRVAEHERTPGDVLELLSQDQNSEIRATVAAHRKIPLHVLNRLSIDDNCDVRLEIASDPNVPHSILSKLAEDENPYVSHQAKRTLQKRAPLEPPVSIDSHKRLPAKKESRSFYA